MDSILPTRTDELTLLGAGSHDNDERQTYDDLDLDDGDEWPSILDIYRRSHSGGVQHSALLTKFLM